MDKEVTGRSRQRLMIEALVSAGPRKSGQEYRERGKELCEDCAGYFAVGDLIIFWICDGMSNSHELSKRTLHPGFNSRILAQDLGEGFARVMGEALSSSNAFDLGIDLGKTLFSEIAEHWQNRLMEYIADVQYEGNLEQLIGAMPEMADGSYRMEWSSTLLGGVYNEQERTLDIVNIGNGGAVVIGEGSIWVTSKTPSLVLIATIVQKDRIRAEIYPVELDTNWKHLDDVKYFLAMSDGVSFNIDLLLRELSELKNASISELRRRLIMRGELTYDDQAVIIGRLMPEKASENKSESY
jgi:hypothetical protein